MKDGKIIRSEDPPNLEMPFETLDGFITPTKSFYVRTHFPIPKIDKSQWRLHVEGEVDKPFKISYDELIALDSRKVPVTLECAGNSRNFLETKVKGVQWALGAVGNAEWTGVPLSILLERAGVRASAHEVVLEGADRGRVNDPKAPTGAISFARSIPLTKANRDVLLAYEINGVELPPEHGFPVRAIVPGWYAMASIKWLTRVIVIERPFNGYYQTLDYAFWKNNELVPLAEIQVRAEIARPAPGEIVPANATTRVRGAAWTSDGEVVKVEVSADGGSTWSDAKLIGDSKPNAWRLWELDWHTPTKPGKQVLIARATDSRGFTQSAERDADRGTYMINHPLPIEVEVR